MNVLICLDVSMLEPEPERHCLAICGSGLYSKKMIRLFKNYHYASKNCSVNDSSLLNQLPLVETIYLLVKGLAEGIRIH
jgi:hypothetical protein